MKGFWQPKRIIVCTFVALTSGIVSAYIGSQISLRVQSQKCQAQPWGLETVCHAWVAPGAIWQGGTTGLYIGTLLGGILGILGTAKINGKQVTVKDELAEVELFANEIELNATQKAALKRFLILVILKVAACSQADSETEVAALSVEELEQLLTIAKHQQLIEQPLTQEQVSQLLAEISTAAQNQQLSHYQATYTSSQAKNN
ncbi:hypothetical protein [Gloeocapsopsis dulcis]|uniref:hypothetical protein n=1 Tax=Gloeocapsopsis dulcis TaxID=2859516 RepID=UPI0018C4E714|nr:hypothetical protein [Gloeocapsopsis dulcis]WNN91235.1 hypothetical protein P0S91_09265 [Gloeocapsopsis dulcis]